MAVFQLCPYGPYGGAFKRDETDFAINSELVEKLFPVVNDHDIMIAHRETTEKLMKHLEGYTRNSFKESIVVNLEQHVDKLSAAIWKLAHRERRKLRMFFDSVKLGYEMHANSEDWKYYAERLDSVLRDLDALQLKLTQGGEQDAVLLPLVAKDKTKMTKLKTTIATRGASYEKMERETKSDKGTGAALV